MKALITGGAGFFGTVLKHHLSEKGVESVIYDLVPDTDKVKNTLAIQGDLCNLSQLEDCFKNHAPFDAVFHVAAQLAHSVEDTDFLWRSNVDGTRNVVEMAVKYKVPHLVFTSSNCLWGIPMGRKIVETDPGLRGDTSGSGTATILVSMPLKSATTSPRTPLPAI